MTTILCNEHHSNDASGRPCLELIHTILRHASYLIVSCIHIRAVCES